MFRAALILLASITFLQGKKANVVTLEQYNAITQKAESDTLYVVNFWATWCKPCVAEMPYFEAADAKFAEQKVKVIFVSLNSLRELEKVNKFITERGIKQDVFLLNAGNANEWIDKVDKSWTGSIPVTVMYHKGKKVFFHEGEFTQTEIDNIIQTKIKQL